MLLGADNVTAPRTPAAVEEALIRSLYPTPFSAWFTSPERSWVSSGWCRRYHPREATSIWRKPTASRPQAMHVKFSVFRWALGVIYDQHIDRASLENKRQPAAFLERRRKTGARIVIPHSNSALSRKFNVDIEFLCDPSPIGNEPLCHVADRPH